MSTKNNLSEIGIKDTKLNELIECELKLNDSYDMNRDFETMRFEYEKPK